LCTLPQTCARLADVSIAALAVDELLSGSELLDTRVHEPQENVVASDSDEESHNTAAQAQPQHAVLSPSQCLPEEGHDVLVRTSQIGVSSGQLGPLLDYSESSLAELPASVSTICGGLACPLCPQASRERDLRWVWLQQAIGSGVDYSRILNTLAVPVVGQMCAG